MRSDADCPTSVRNISARLGPSQSIVTSVEALWNGRMASETGCTAAAGFTENRSGNLSRKA